MVSRPRLTGRAVRLCALALLMFSTILLSLQVKAISVSGQSLSRPTAAEDSTGLATSDLFSAPSVLRPQQADEISTPVADAEPTGEATDKSQLEVTPEPTVGPDGESSDKAKQDPTPQTTTAPELNTPSHEGGDKQKAEEPVVLGKPVGPDSLLACPDGQFEAEYFNNRFLTGPPTFRRCESRIEQNWGLLGPGGGIGFNEFSVRWTGRFTPWRTGDYSFRLRADDGVQVFLDGRMIIDGWRDQAPTTYYGRALDLNPSSHQIKVEYYEAFGGASIRMDMDMLYGGSFCKPTAPRDKWCAEYYRSNTDADGVPAHHASEEATGSTYTLERDWGGNGPVFPWDFFSARWVGEFYFHQTGIWNFAAYADDGIRVYIDGSLVIDEWRDQAPRLFQASRRVEAGYHTVKVLYYERIGGAVAKVRWQIGSASCTSNYNQWCAKYYNGRSPAGSPVIERNEAASSPWAIDKNWYNSSPATGVGNDNFSVRWEGRFNFASSGDYVFSAVADDGVRIYVDDALIVNYWIDQGPTLRQGSTRLNAGDHTVRVEYYEAYGGAQAQVKWEFRNSTATCPSDKYRAEYFNNVNLQGAPTLVRCESWPINYTWGMNGPGGGIGRDNFSARWTGRATIEAGSYWFKAVADDGVKVWIDGRLKINGWRDQGPTEYAQNTLYTNSQVHDIVVEYYERAGGATMRFWWERVAPR